MTDPEEMPDDCVQEGLENIVSREAKERRFEAWAAKAVTDMYADPRPSEYFFNAVENSRPDKIKDARWYRDNILDMYLDAKRYWFRHREYDERMAETLALAETFKYLFQRANGEPVRYRKMTDLG
jgi:hypothetical protein